MPMGGAEGNMRMRYVQYDDEARYVYQVSRINVHVQSLKRVARNMKT